jgi:hypothetical protein
MTMGEANDCEHDYQPVGTDEDDEGVYTVLECQHCGRIRYEA